MLCAAVARGVSSQVQALKRFRAPASGTPFVADDVTDKDLCDVKHTISVSSGSK